MTEQEAAEILLGKPVKERLLAKLSLLIDEELRNVVMFRGNVNCELPMSVTSYVIMIRDEEPPR